MIDEIKINMNMEYYISPGCKNDDGSHICEINYNITMDENFPITYQPLYVSFSYLLICLLSVYTIYYFEKGVNTEISKPCCSFQFLMSVMFLLSSIYDFQKGYDICEYPIHCHEGLNDSIVTTNYYYELKHCIDKPYWLIDFYNEKNENSDRNCENTEYGCCEIPTEEMRCSELTLEITSFIQYSEYLSIYEGRWTVHESKVDIEGSNCPTIEDIIYELSVNDKNEFIYYFIYCVIINLVIVLGTILFIRSRKYLAVNSQADVFTENNEVIKASA